MGLSGKKLGLAVKYENFTGRVPTMKSLPSEK